MIIHVGKLVKKEIITTTIGDVIIMVDDIYNPLIKMSKAFACVDGLIDCPWLTNLIIVDKEFYELGGEEVKFVIGHEIGHLALGHTCSTTVNELAADDYAIRVHGARPMTGLSLLTHTYLNTMSIPTLTYLQVGKITLEISQRALRLVKYILVTKVQTSVTALKWLFNIRISLLG